MKKPTQRELMDDRIERIRLTHSFATSLESDNNVVNALLSDIGVLLDELTFWRSEYNRILNTHNDNTSIRNDNIDFNNTHVSEKIIYLCPRCDSHYTDDEYQGLSWIDIGLEANERGSITNIGYMHCSNCGVDSPLYSCKEFAEDSWCAYEMTGETH